MAAISLGTVSLITACRGIRGERYAAEAKAAREEKIIVIRMITCGGDGLSDSGNDFNYRIERPKKKLQRSYHLRHPRLSVILRYRGKPVELFKKIRGRAI